MENSDIKYDLSRIICFLVPDNEFINEKFHQLNKKHFAPILGEDAVRSSLREGTPHSELSELSTQLLAVTTDASQLFNPARGCILGSDKDLCDIRLDQGYECGISAQHLRLYLSDVASVDISDSMRLQNISLNCTIRVASVDGTTDVQLRPQRTMDLKGGAWDFVLTRTLRFQIVFPERTNASEYVKNWEVYKNACIAADHIHSPAAQSKTAPPVPRTPGYSIDTSVALGEGISGTVWKAKSATTKEILAMKIFKHAGGGRIESDILSMVRQPNIVKYREFIQSDGKDILIMEFLTGGTLRDAILTSKGPLPGAKMYWCQMAGALKYLHSRQILHRDLKPANVMFSITPRGDKVLKLCDFGFSKRLDISWDLTKTQLGTPWYAAPEICLGTSYSYPVDIWALGIIVLDMYRISPIIRDDFRISKKQRQDRGEKDEKAFQDWLTTIQELVSGLNTPELEPVKTQLHMNEWLRPVASELEIQVKASVKSSYSSAKRATTEAKPSGSSKEAKGKKKA